MRKIIIFLLLIVAVSFYPREIYAATQAGDCTWEVRDGTGNIGPPLTKGDLGFSSTDFSINVPFPNKNYNIEVKCTGLEPCAGPFFNKNKQSDANNRLGVGFFYTFVQTSADIVINVNDPGSPVNPTCLYKIEPSDWIAKPTPTPSAFADCELSIDPAAGIKNNTQLTVRGKVKNVRGSLDSSTASIYAPGPTDENLYGIWSTISVQGMGNSKTYYPSVPSNLEFQSGIQYWPNGTYYINASVYVVDANVDFMNNWGAYAKCQASFEVCDSGCGALPTLTPTPSLAQGAPTYTPIPPIPSLAPLCDQVADKNSPDQNIRNLYITCDQCVNRDHGIWTAIGCVPTDLELILKNYVFVFGTGIAGGIAFLYFLYGVFLILTSAGNAEKIAEGKEIIISALSGLFLIIFSVFLLRVIGYDILKIPGFG